MIEYKTIAKPYLIQRGSFKDTKEEDIVGIDSLISYDYMGSAEFEFGALSHSLRCITSSWDSYQVILVPGHDADGQAPYLLCRKGQAEEIQAALKIFMEKEYTQELRTKERVSLYNYLHPESKYDLRINFWWDVTEGNDWMLCFGAPNMWRLVTAINKVCVKHSSTLIGPELPKPSFKPPAVDFDWEQDHSRIIVTIQNKRAILVRKNIVSMEEWPDQLKIMVNTKTGLKPIYLKTCHGQARQAMVNSIKEIVEFNSRR